MVISSQQQQQHAEVCLCFQARVIVALEPLQARVDEALGPLQARVIVALEPLQARVDEALGPLQARVIVALEPLQARVDEALGPLQARVVVALGRTTSGQGCCGFRQDHFRPGLLWL